jgi:hypothetical protein
MNLYQYVGYSQTVGGGGGPLLLEAFSCLVRQNCPKCLMIQCGIIEALGVFQLNRL